MAVFPRGLARDLRAGGRGGGFNAAGHGRGRSPAREIARHRRVNSGRRGGKSSPKSKVQGLKPPARPRRASLPFIQGGGKGRWDLLVRVHMGAEFHIKTFFGTSMFGAGIGWNPRRPHDILQLPHERRQGRDLTPRPFGRRVRFGKRGDLSEDSVQEMQGL